MKPKRIAVVYGGYSGEAEISRLSAAMVLKHMDRARYEPIPVSIDAEAWLAHLNGQSLEIDRHDFSYELGGLRHRPDRCLIMIHGSPGEDGTLQGYFDMIGMPYTTGSVLNTALTFNKLYTTRIMRQMGFDAARGIKLNPGSMVDLDGIGEELGYPLFVKPNEGGSSLGVSKVKAPDELQAALDLAFSKGGSALVEEYLSGRELTCGVVCTGGHYQALAITEISTRKEFFDYAAKYDYDQTEEITPAQLDKNDYLRCQNLSVEIARAFDCRGIVRIDYKYDAGNFRPIEINTVPGMTEKSIVPQQAEACGIGKSELITALIEDEALAVSDS